MIRVKPYISGQYPSLQAKPLFWDPRDKVFSSLYVAGGIPTELYWTEHPARYVFCSNEVWYDYEIQPDFNDSLGAHDRLVWGLITTNPTMTLFEIFTLLDL